MTVRFFVLCVLFVLIALARLADAQSVSTQHAVPRPAKGATRPQQKQSVPSLQSTRLTDGTVVTLEGVTYGRDRQFHGMLIESISALGSRQPDRPEAVILWLRAVRPASSPKANMAVRPYAVRVYDDMGKEVFASELSVSTAYPSQDHHAILLYNWPRRSGYMTIEASYNYGRQAGWLAKFRVNNPVVSKVPPFPARSMPITCHDAELAVTLQSLYQIGPIMDWSGPAERLDLYTRARKLYTRANFAYEFHRQGTSDWAPTSVTVTDSTGNPYTSSASSLYQPPKYPLTYDRSDTNEPLKLAVWFNRTADASFAPNETCVMKDLPMRFGRYPQTPGTTARVGDITLEFNHIDQTPFTKNSVDIVVNIYGGDTHIAPLMQVRNQRGELAKGIGPNANSRWIASSMDEPRPYLDGQSTPERPFRCAHFLVDLPPGTTRITCTIAINRGHYFEFTPTPTIREESSWWPFNKK